MNFEYNKTRLIGITQPEISGCETAEDIVAFAARVSNPANQASNLNTSKLLGYLIKHKHWSPFEMVNVIVEVETSRDIARQLLRHRSFSFQELSQRYCNPVDLTGFVTREARLQDTVNRQNSIPTDDKELKRMWDEQQRQVIALAKKAYTWATANGIAKEQARSVLPEGNTISRLYVNGTLRSWLHYCQLRRSNGTQLEHMDLATKCWEHIADNFPAVASAVTNLDLN